MELRGRQRADRAPQPQLPGRSTSGDGSAHPRLRPHQRPLVPAAAARPGVDPRALPGRPRGRSAVIRAVRPEDAAELAALYLANREFLAPFEPARPPEFFTADGQRARLERQLADATHP